LQYLPSLGGLEKMSALLEEIALFQDSSEFEPNEQTENTNNFQMSKL